MRNGWELHCQGKLLAYKAAFRQSWRNATCAHSSGALSPVGTADSCLRQQHPLTATGAIRASDIADAESEGKGVQNRLTRPGQPEDSCLPALCLGRTL